MGIRAGLVLAAAASLLGCGTPPFPEWRLIGYDENATHAFPAVWEDRWTAQEIGSIRIPDNSSTEGAFALYYADVVDDGQREVVLCSDRRLLVFTENAHLAARVEFAAGPRMPGFLRDFDGDGKRDLFVGSSSASRCILSVFNGRGDLVMETIPAGKRDYRALVPLFDAAGALYVLAKPGWVDAPRGLLCYGLPGFRESWEFVIPSEPLGCVLQRDAGGGETFTISNRTAPEGAFNSIGRSRNNAYLEDAWIHLIRADRTGEIRLNAELRVDGAPMIGSGYFHLLGPRDVDRLLLLRIEDEELPVGEQRRSLHVIQPHDGAVTASSGFGIGELRDMRIVSYKGGSAIVVLLQGKGGWALRQLDDSLKTVRDVRFTATNAALGTTLASHEIPIDQARFFLIEDGRLVLYDFRLQSRLIATVPGCRQMLFTSLGSQGRIVALGDSLTVFRLRRSGS